MIPIAIIILSLFALCIWCCLVVGSRDDDVNNRG